MVLFVSGASSAAPLSKGAVEPTRIYKEKCSVCHGDKGNGSGLAAVGLEIKPRDFTSPVAGAELDKARMIASVTLGRAGTAMRAWQSQLSAKEIESVVDYIRKTFMTVTSKKDEPGRKLFSLTCSVCHGEKGNGKSRAADGLRTKPRNFTSDKSKEELTRERMIKSVTYGVPDSPMVGWGVRLKPQEIETVVDYIRKTFMGIDPEDAKKRAKAIFAEKMGKPAWANSGDGASLETYMAEVMPKGLTGDPTRGGDFFNKNCYVCHGKSGQGDGPRSRFINPKPRNFRHSSSLTKYNRPTLFKSISDGRLRSEMPAWKHVLSDQQIADVAEYVFQTFIHPEQEKKKGEG